MRRSLTAILAALFLAAPPNVAGYAASAQTSVPHQTLGGLSRASGSPVDEVPGARIEYGVLHTRDGSRLRTLFSRPTDSSQRVPVIYFVQWLSCSTVELRDDDGWTQMLTELIGKSGYAVMRTEKSGVGDSTGIPCSELDYDTEVAHHREALAALFARDEIDPRNVFIFGGSMGATQAPLIAQGYDIAGVIAWGGGAKSWYERMLGFDRRSLELGAEPPETINALMAARARFHSDYLLRQRTPPEIILAKPAAGPVWDGMIGTSRTDHYGRPFAFHHQAQSTNWPEAWAAIRAPVLVLYGEYDWFEDAGGHRWIADIVNSQNAGAAHFHVLAQTNHHFTRYPDPVAAFREEDGVMVGDEAARLIASWIADNLRR